MSEIRYINLNGTLVEASQPVIMHDNRAFRYGDALFETIRLMHGEVLFLEKHLNRLRRGMKELEIEWPSAFSFQNLHLLIRHLDQVNHLKGNGRIRLEVFRKDGGWYIPGSNEAGFLLEAEALADTDYTLNEAGLRLGLYTEISKPLYKLSNMKSSNALLYVMAGLFRKKSGFDDVLLFNSEGNVAEALASNVFAVNRGEFVTPSLDQSCVAGVMRERIIEFLRSKNRKCAERKLSLNDLLNADEVFLTNVIDGIRWVGAIRDKRYFNSLSKSLVSELAIVPEKS